MALIPCPAPNCDEQVVENWLTCPKCQCPVQVLRAAQSSKPPPPEEGFSDEEARQRAEDLAVLEEVVQTGTPEERDQALELKEQLLQEEATRIADEEAWEQEPPPPPQAPSERESAVIQMGKLVMGLGGGSLLGMPLVVYKSPDLAMFLAMASVALLGGGWLIIQVMESP